MLDETRRRHPLAPCSDCAHTVKLYARGRCSSCYKRYLRARPRQSPIPGQDERIARYQTRAAQGLPLFEERAR